MAKISTPFKLSFLDYPENTHCISVYMIGCDNHCDGCHNPELSNPNYDIWVKDFDIDKFYNVLMNESNRFKTLNVSLIGGDPLYKDNISFTKQFLSYNKLFNICLYTGYDVDFVKDHDIIGFTYLKTGKFLKECYVDAEKTDKYFQLSSTNQEIYDSEFNLLTDKGKLIYKD